MQKIIHYFLKFKLTECLLFYLLNLTTSSVTVYEHQASLSPYPTLRPPLGLLRVEFASSLPRKGVASLLPGSIYQPALYGDGRAGRGGGMPDTGIRQS